MVFLSFTTWTMEEDWPKLQCPKSKPPHSTYNLSMPKSDMGYSILLPNHHIPPIISVCQTLQLKQHHYSLYTKGQVVPLIKHTVKMVGSLCKASHTCSITPNKLAATAHWTLGFVGLTESHSTITICFSDCPILAHQTSPASCDFISLFWNDMWWWTVVHLTQQYGSFSSDIMPDIILADCN
jgi:hypothetical protein